MGFIEKGGANRNLGHFPVRQRFSAGHQGGEQMHITLIRKYKRLSECTYRCLEYPSYTGFAKRAILGKSSIVLYHNEQENLNMSQKNLSDIIKYFPLRFLGLNCAPYHIYEYKEGEIGYSKQSLFVPECAFYIAQNIYVLRGHSKKKHSLTKDGKQIALFTVVDEGNTRIDFAEQDGALISFLILFAIFIDIQYYAYRGATTYTYVHKDKWKKLSEWTPDESIRRI